MKNYELHSDKELVGLLRKKHPVCNDAFNILYGRYRKKLFSYCLFLCGNRDIASDLFQEAWIKFDAAAKKGIAIENPLAYLISISRKEYLYNLRRDSARSKIIGSDSSFAADEFTCCRSGEHDFEKKELIDLIQKAVNSLDENYREAFVLKRFDELSYKEMSQICGESVDCMKTRVSRATSMVKELLKEYIKELI